MTLPRYESPGLKQPLTKSEIIQRITNMQSNVKSPIANKLLPPKRPDHRFSDYLRSPKISAQVISFDDNQHSNFTLNSSYNELSMVSYLHQCFDIVSQIGEGSFGNVYKVKDKITNELFAIKVSKIKFRNKNDRKEKLKEVKWHIVLPTHPNCVKLYNAWEQDANLYIQIELCIGSLDMLVQYSINNHKRVEENSLWEMLFDILQGLQNLHKLDFVHMDLKSANIFISDDGICKLGDFGLVLDLSNVSSSEEEGDSKYLAAEVLSGVYTKSADIFSLGIVILELAAMVELPSCGPAWHELRCGRLPDEYIEYLSEDMKNIIIQMINPIYSLRPSTSDLLKHPRFKYLKWKRLAQRSARKVKNVIIPIASKVIAAVCSLVDPLVKMYNILCTRYSSHRHIEVASPCISDEEDSYVAFASHFKDHNRVNRVNTPACERNAMISTPILRTPPLDSCRSTMLQDVPARPTSVNHYVRNDPTPNACRLQEVGLRHLPRAKNLFSEFRD